MIALFVTICHWLLELLTPPDLRQIRYIREGTFFLGGGGLGNFGIFFPKKCWPFLAF